MKLPDGNVVAAGIDGQVFEGLKLNLRPPVARAQAPPDFSELGPSYHGADPAYAD